MPKAASHISSREMIQILYPVKFFPCLYFSLIEERIPLLTLPTCLAVNIFVFESFNFFPSGILHSSQYISSIRSFPYANAQVNTYLPTKKIKFSARPKTNLSIKTYSFLTVLVSPLASLFNPLSKNRSTSSASLPQQSIHPYPLRLLYT